MIPFVFAESSKTRLPFYSQPTVMNEDKMIIITNHFIYFIFHNLCQWMATLELITNERTGRTTRTNISTCVSSCRNVRVVIMKMKSTKTTAKQSEVMLTYIFGGIFFTFCYLHALKLLDFIHEWLHNHKPWFDTGDHNPNPRAFSRLRS